MPSAMRPSPTPSISRSELQIYSKRFCTACQSCGTRAIDSIFVGMGGMSAPSDVEVVRGMLNGLDLNPAAVIGIDHDVRVALAGGTAGHPASR